jgi:FKBP-type peptidyl-prolyl cis-trans isomerase
MEATDIAEPLQDTDVGVDEVSQDEPSPPPEKMLTVSRVNELVKKAKRDGERKMQEQLDAAKQQIEQLQQQQAQPPMQQQQQPMQQQQQPQQQGMSPEQMQQVMQLMQQKQQEEAEKAHQAQLEKEVNEVAQNYFGKLAQGKEMFDDFDAVTANFDPAAFPQLVYLATQSDNTAAIIYELQKNPAKLAQLSVLVDKSPAMARNEIAKLSQSIKTNDEAKKNLQEAQDPLNRLKPSPVGTDNGTKTVRDFKSANYLKA